MTIKNTTKKTLLATSLLLAFASTAGATCWTTECAAAAENKRHEDAVEMNLPSVERSIGAFYRTLGLKNDGAVQGLTIAWRSSAYRNFDHGVAVATGRLADGCPEFEVSVLQKSWGTHGDRLNDYRANIFFCPVAK